MRAISFVLLVYILCSCEFTDRVAEDATSIPEQAQYDLVGKTFTIASSRDFDGKCKTILECDCCSGDLYFLNDSVFYDAFYCVEDVTLLKGSFQISKDTLTLNYSGNALLKKYNWEAENDSTLKHYVYERSTYKAMKTIYLFAQCEDLIKLKPIDPKSMEGLEGRKEKDVLLNLITEIENQIAD